MKVFWICRKVTILLCVKSVNIVLLFDTILVDHSGLVIIGGWHISRVYMDTSDPIRSGRTAHSEEKMIRYTPQSEYNSLIGLEFHAE